MMTNAYLDDGGESFRKATYTQERDSMVQTCNGQGSRRKKNADEANTLRPFDFDCPDHLDGYDDQDEINQDGS